VAGYELDSRGSILAGIQMFLFFSSINFVLYSLQCYANYVMCDYLIANYLLEKTWGLVMRSVKVDL